jgi:hypothetical protein
MTKNKRVKKKNYILITQIRIVQYIFIYIYKIKIEIERRKRKE